MCSDVKSCPARQLVSVRRCSPGSRRGPAGGVRSAFTPVALRQTGSCMAWVPPGDAGYLGPASDRLRVVEGQACSGRADGALVISSWCTPRSSLTRSLTRRRGVSGCSPAAEASASTAMTPISPAGDTRGESGVVRPVQSAVLGPAGVSDGTGRRPIRHPRRPARCAAARQRSGRTRRTRPPRAPE
jgi:hypothetical protein